MELSNIIKSFAEKIIDIELYQRAAKKTVSKELDELNKCAEQLKNNPQLKNLICSSDAMHFYDANTGFARRYGYRKSTVEDRVNIVVRQKNKQYCWLLAEAYEEFEDFLESIYAYIGYKDNSSWLLCDFGKITLSELNEKEYDWYLNCAKSKRDIPQSILSRIRDLYPKLVEVETNNKLNVNLKVAIELIEKLRHIIVHKGGVVSERDTFIEKVLKKSGVWNNGRYDLAYKTFIEKFFGNGEYENTISLLEIRTHLEIPLDIYHDLYGELSHYLMAYAFLIYENIAKDESHSTGQNT